MMKREDVKPNPISTKKAVLFSVIFTCFLLLLGEIGIRVWAHYFRTSYERYNTDSGRLELVPNTHFTIAPGKELRINSKGFVGPEFVAKKATGVFRAFALGDSCTFGYSKDMYPGRLLTLLNLAMPEQQFEMINAGISGYNSEYALGRLKEDILKYEPDLVTIYIGWNDLMKGNPDNLSATGRYTRLAGLLERSYLMKAYRKLIFFYLRPLILKPKQTSDESEIHHFDLFVPLAYQKNLEAMIEVLQERNIRPLLMTRPTVVRPGMTYEEIQREHVVFPYYGGSYSVEKFLSLHRSYNNVIRSIALRLKVPLVDLDRIFNEYDKDDLFWDTMHPSLKGHKLIAQSLLKKVQELVD